MRVWPKVVIETRVRNASSRDAQTPKIIVLHSTESHNRPGSGDLAAVAAWFNDPASQASSHVITDANGHSARCVVDALKAWTCAGYNAASLNIEQIGHASQTRWSNAELDETARWIALWSRKWGIPIRRGRTAGGVVLRKGVVKHSSLGSIGGGHSDPGKNYPLDIVLGKARNFKELQK